MEGYPPIAEHGLIGDLQTAALVTTDGSVDWWCCPRFDSPSVFASLLDRDNGGQFRIGPEGDDYVARQLYFPRHRHPDHPVHDPRGGRRGARLHADRRPPPGQRPAPAGPGGAVCRGQMRFVAECAPRFDYGRQAHELELTDEGAVFRTPTMALTLHGAGRRSDAA